MGELYKSEKEINHEPWAILIALASLIIVATLIAIIALFILWKRYTKSRILYESGLVKVPFEQVKNEQRSKEYEIQSLDMFVPQDDRDDLGEVHIGVSPKDGIKSIHHVKDLQLMQSQLPDSQPKNFDYEYCESENFRAPMDKLYRRVMHYTKLNGRF